jgi:S-adenosylmethionine/arginine decarboxylase-like enzyme
MTHTLHRSGDPESLAHDYVIFAIAAQGINSQGAAPKFRRFAEIVLKYNPVNFGDMKTGNMFSVDKEKILESFKENSIVHAVFTDKDTLLECLKEVKEADIGLSIVVSGLVHEVGTLCKAAGTAAHTVEHSLGIHGATEKLPPQAVLDISTMCGHGMVAFSLVEHLVEEVKAGRITVEQAARELAKQCVCGVFNPVRAAEIIRKLL